MALFRRRREPQHGPRGIAQVGHRRYVGGMWDEIGRLQFDFLVEQGLRPHHVLVDVACGSLRGGMHFIRHLEAGNYLGIDKERDLIEAGLREEVPSEVAAEKRPELVVSDAFEFDRFTKRADYALAQSLFTHLPAAMVQQCLDALGRWAPPHLRLFATFFEAGETVENPSEPHDLRRFWYTAGEMRELGAAAGWEILYVGEWGHPRGQRMLEYRRRS